MDRIKFNKLCDRVQELNDLRDSDTIRPNSKVCICMIIDRCMCEITEELVASGYTLNKKKLDTLELGPSDIACQ
jgi:hypothetical protein